MADSLRIAYDVTPLIGNRTGIGVFTAGLLAELQLNPEVDVRRFAVTWRGRAEAGSAARWPMPARPLRALWRRVSAPPIEWFTGRVDVVHGTNFVVPPTTHAARVVSVHDLTAVRYPQLCTSDTLQYPELVRRAIAQGAFVHTDTQAVADEVIAWSGIDASRVRAVHPGVDAPGCGGRVAPGDVGSRTIPAPYVLALGTIEPRKDHPTLLRAFAELAADDADLRLVVAGQDGWGSEAFARTMATLEPRVRYRVSRIGWVSDAHRAELIAHAAVFAYPSLYEGFGFPPLEAMTLGIPVVATRIAALTEVLGDAAAFAPVGDPIALAATLRSVLGDTAEHGRLAQEGRRRAAGYRWATCAGAMIEIYRAAVAAR